MRYDEDNCHRQCAQCNNYDSGNIVEYRINLILKIGEERVSAIERDNSVAKYTIDDAKNIIEIYKKKIKDLG